MLAIVVSENLTLSGAQLRSVCVTVRILLVQDGSWDGKSSESWEDIKKAIQKLRSDIHGFADHLVECFKGTEGALEKYDQSQAELKLSLAVLFPSSATGCSHPRGGDHDGPPQILETNQENANGWVGATGTKLCEIGQIAKGWVFSALINQLEKKQVDPEQLEEVINYMKIEKTNADWFMKS